MAHSPGTLEDARSELRGLPRTPLPRTWVNKGKEKGQGCYAPALVRHYTLVWLSHHTQCRTHRRSCGR
jgi:hypothetical protein